jgi:hypothetical protein
MSFDAIPAELRERPQWVTWKLEKRDGRSTKVPYRADGAGRASSTDPSTWATFENALDATESLNMDGVGYVFAADDPYCGIDLDAALPPTDHAAIMLALNSYTETSVSGAGAHVIIQAALTGGRHPAGLGVFDRGRYFVMTGAHVYGTPNTIEERQAQLDTVLARYLPTAVPRPLQPAELDDRDLLERAFAARNGADFHRLYQGDTSGYPSRSEADFAFCCTAAFWTGRDPARIDAWLRSSGLMRDKWERADYRERTINAAIAGSTDVYTSRLSAVPRLSSASRNGDTAGRPAGLELRIVPLSEFANVDEPGAAAVLGTPDSAVIPQGGDAMVYGDGGVGKTTLCVDLACHLAAGQPWLGLEVPNPVRVLLVENEGPRPLFRRKLQRKLTAWNGNPIGDRVSVLEEPWGQLNFADPAWRAALATAIADRQTDVLIAGPVTSAGMEGAGTIAEARAFLALIDNVRRLSNRPVAVILVHHENKGGKVSGAWEGTGDTLLHVQQQGHGKIRVYFQKARWASDQHATTLHLAWADGDSFTLDDAVVADRPERTWNDIAAFVREHGGTGWGAVRDSVEGETGYLTRRRAAMLEDGVLVNAGTIQKYELWHRDDPARPQLVGENETL